MPARVEFRVAERGTKVLARMAIDQTQWSDRPAWIGNQPFACAQESNSERVGAELGFYASRNRVH